ncbi:hypothetical protein K432DRAFT_349054 [Lepidopterella palustris CBS 459.81]|uniref:Uncharacterized protein n=1 Tax=Lepidopterella palustris CBS 459.81 TaxID=1314670 RepID=A0A8E2EER5_9PEZI|nr:hypothetical protein K432DRAFT_349054 [Lepidopterella palustris CBS 459.81]
MGLINVRELLEYPYGDNSSDTIINGVHFNLTALNLYNYTIYSNNTISNDSNCYLIFDTYQPHMFANGSWINGTSCYGPYYHIRGRGIASIAFGTLFAVSIMFTLVNLRKHGRLFLREDKRFRVVGRRWQWYWMVFVAACGMISCITGIDVDRWYLQDLPIVLQSFFFCLMLPGTLAMVWEATRHWGSWQERQICDRDPFLLPQDDKRGRTEFYLPLIFYLFAWLNFFMVIPRSWSPLEEQNDKDQQEFVARPSGTDTREKAGAIMAALAWFAICFSLHHSLYYYKPRASGLWNKINSFCLHCPTKLFLSIAVLSVRIAYALASAWEWNISIFKYNVDLGWPFGLGFGTTLVIIFILEIAGYLEENEDKIIIDQRRERGRSVNQELGLVNKPSWWSKAQGDRHLDDEQRLRNLTTEIGGGRPTARHVTANVELGNMRTLRNRSRDRPAEDPFRDHSPTQDSIAGNRLTVARTESDNASTRTGATGMTGRTLGENTQPQTIRSMLDV